MTEGKIGRNVKVIEMKDGPESAGKAEKRHLQRIRCRKIDDVGMGMQVRRPHTEIVGGQRHRGY